MNQRILLADNSYTIRRIVELSFQDIENVELFSFESGANLKEKLLEIVPQIVLIDIKLPEFNGYEACQFINDEPSLKDSKVLLMKGGFEPIDENLLKDLNYEDIITKPFDSKLLESQVIKLLEEIGTNAPSPPLSIPEELDVPSFSENIEGENIDIETADESSSFPDNLPVNQNNKDIEKDKELDEISFSDINNVIDKENETLESEETSLIKEESEPVVDEVGDMSFKDAVNEIETPDILSEEEMIASGRVINDEVEPSEEITQGAYEEQDDSLLSEPEDEISNPFKDESETKPEETSSETDDHNLKEQIKMHEDELGIESLTIEEMRIQSEIENRNKGIDDEEEDYGTDSFTGLDKKPNFDNISFNDEDEKEPIVEKEESVVNEVKEKVDSSIFAAAEGILNDSIDFLDEDNKSIDEPINDMDISVTDDRDESSDIDSIYMAEEKAQFEESPSKEKEAVVEESVDQESTEHVADFMTEKEDDSDSLINMPEFGEVEEEIAPNLVKEEPEIESEILAEVKISEPVSEPIPEVVYEEKIEEPQIDVSPTEEVAESVSDDAPHVKSEEMEKIIERVEDKLTISIKEILWDVIPPLAERIIKEEITSLKAEIDKKDI